MSRLPLIGVTSCPLQAFVPAASDILDGLDGSLVTGASSNIELFFEHGSAIASYVAHDSARANLQCLSTLLSRRVFVRGNHSGNLYQATPTRQTTPDLQESGNSA